MSDKMINPLLLSEEERLFLANGQRFTVKPDPEDPRFVIVALRAPNAGQPVLAVDGLMAPLEFARFAAGFLLTPFEMEAASLAAVYQAAEQAAARDAPPAPPPWVADVLKGKRA